MPSLNLVLYNLSGNMKLSLEKKIIGGLGLAILMIALMTLVTVQTSSVNYETAYFFYVLAGTTLFTLLIIFFRLRKDISGYQHVNQQLQSSRELVQRFMDSANELVQSVASDGSFITVNKTWLKTLGYTDDDVKDLKIYEIIAPESQKTFADLFQKLCNQGGDENIEVTYIAKDGKKVMLEGTSTCVSQPGNISHAQFFFRDITYKKNIEKELQKLNNELAQRVKEKTTALEEANSMLQMEITEHKQIEKQLRHLSSRLQLVREEERTRIAREIHDELGQQLTGIKLDLSWVGKKIHEECAGESEKKVKKILLSIDEAIKTVRKISTDLRPGVLDDLGLVAAIEWQCHEFEKRNGIPCIFSTPLGDIDFGTTISTEVFRIVQEALTNVLRHAEATEVKISMKIKEDDLLLDILDNGKGISKAEVNNHSTFGLLGIGERAKLIGGAFSIKGEPGKGTLVELQIPLEHTIERK